MRQINPIRAGASVGVVLGLWHLAWASIVLAGWAKPILDFVFRLHFIDLAVQIFPFAFGTAAALVGLTLAIGYLFGFVFAVIWNWLAVPAEQVRATSARA